MRNIELPGKKLQKDLSQAEVERRRLGLERYLQTIIRIPAACQTVELRKFFSQAIISLLPSLSTPQNFVRQMRTIVDDVLAAPTYVETLIQGLTRQASAESMITEDDMLAASLGSLTSSVISATAQSTPEVLVAGGPVTAFTAPLGDLLVELLNLKGSQQWIRRQAVLIFVQQILGTTIERRIRDGVRLAFATDSLLGLIKTLSDGLFPAGEKRAPSVPRSAIDKAATRDSAQRKLSALVPMRAKGAAGPGNVRRATRTVFELLQHRRLTAHLLYTLIDDAVAVLFPDL